MPIDEQPMNVYWSGQKSPTSNKYKINYKGTVATASDLPATGNKKGDTYNISEDGSDYIWTGSEWNKFGANVYIGATSTANGIQGLVPPATIAQMYSLLTGMGTWQSAEYLGLALDSDVVHKIGDETVGGKKTFTSVPQIAGPYPQIEIKCTKAEGENKDVRFLNAANVVQCCIRAGKNGTLTLGSRVAGEEVSWYEGAVLILQNNGDFICSSSGGVAAKQLVGKPDGTLTWDGQSIQTTSDARLKTPLADFPDAVLDAWEAVEWGQYKFLEAVASKGESARLHSGMIAQDVKAVFDQHGLDASDYGILCYDSEKDRWMVRYTEALAMEAACQRRKVERAEAKIKVLEDRLSALEEKLA